MRKATTDLIRLMKGNTEAVQGGIYKLHKNGKT